MAGVRAISWKQCQHRGCVGVQLATVDWCLAHAQRHDHSAFQAEFNRIGEEGTIDARGVDLDDRLLKRILAAASPQDGHPTLKRARFNAATFHNPALFDEVVFQGPAVFDETTFHDHAIFDNATFQSLAGFGGATFNGGARFGGATFERGARFSGVLFGREANFGRSIFMGGAWFGKTTYQREASFTKATFHQETEFNGARFEQGVRFQGATFERARQLGPLVARYLVFDDAVFSERIQLEASTAALCLRRAKFPAGVQLRLRWAWVVLSDADLAAPSILSSVPSFPEVDEDRFARAWARLLPEPRVELQWRGQPRLVSVRRADVAGLAISQVDLRACQFADAHNLDRLRVETVRAFAHTPGGWRWAARQSLAEEQHYRQRRAANRAWTTQRPPRPGRPPAAGRRSWYPPACRPPAWTASSEPAEPLAPAQIADLYRALRKGREDSKDEPGAVDFYYGEMEMRRHARHEQAREERRQGHWGAWAAARSEHAILWMYWLTSGYALRAWRALVLLVAVILIAAVAFTFWGFPPSEPRLRAVGVDASGVLTYQQLPEQPVGVEQLPAAIRFSVQSATALLRGPDRALTPLGEWLEIALRFLGPALLALVVLSIRGRVRR